MTAVDFNQDVDRWLLLEVSGGDVALAGASIKG